MTHSRDGTAAKIATCSVCIGYHVNRAARRGAVMYHHVDNNAGGGPHHGDFRLNGVAIRNIVGTPDLILRRTTLWPHLRFKITLVERSPRRLASLRAYIARKYRHVNEPTSLFDPHPRVEVTYIRGDNTQALAAYAATVEDPETAQGSLLFDPTGPSPKRGGAIPMPVIAAAAAALPRFMLLVQVPQGHNKRPMGFKEQFPDRPCSVQRVSEFLPLRPHWVISETFGLNGALIVLAGTDYLMPEYHKHDPRLYRITSMRGRELLRKCEEMAPLAERMRRRRTKSPKEVSL